MTSHPPFYILQVPLGVKSEAPEGFGFHSAGDVDLVFTPVTVERMRPKVSEP